MRVVPNLAGTWRGELRILDDTRTSAAGPFRQAVGLKAPLEFDLRQSHDAVSGTGVVLAPLPTGAVGPVTADWDSISTIHLHGTFKTDEGFEAELTEWTSEDDGGANNMIGRFTMTARFDNFWGPQVIVKQCDIVTLTHVAR